MLWVSVGIQAGQDQAIIEMGKFSRFARFADIFSGVVIVLVIALDVYLKRYTDMIGWCVAFMWWYYYFSLKTSIEDFMRK